MQLDKRILKTTDAYVKKLADAGVSTVADFLSHYPKSLENRSDVLTSFSYVNLKEKNAVAATLETVATERTRNGKLLTKAVLKDVHGYLTEAVYFNRPYSLSKLRPGDAVTVF